jgi:uncharacterized protein (TIGR00251 family)
VPDAPKVLLVGDKKCRLSFKIIPGSSRNEVAGELGDSIKVKLKAPPVDGRANEALKTFLAKKLGLRPSAFEIVAGATNRKKIIALAGLSELEARTRLLEHK